MQRTHQEELRAQEKAKKAIEKDVKKILKEHMKQQKQQMIEEKKLKDLLNVMVLQVGSSQYNGLTSRTYSLLWSSM